MPSGLVKHEPIANRRERVAQDSLGVDAPRDGQPELELLVDDAVPPDDDRAGLVHLVLTAAEDLGEHVGREFSSGKSDDVQRREWLTAHRIDVRQRIRCRDLPEEVRVVDDRREEVDRLHEREIVGQHEHAGIVERFAANEQARIRLQRN